MAKVHTSEESITRIIDILQKTSIGLECDMEELQNTYSQAAIGWNDKKYHQLGDVIKIVDVRVRNVIEAIDLSKNECLKWKQNLQEYNATLFYGYTEAQKKQDIHALITFDVYKSISHEIDNKIVNKTFNGITIKGKKNHFIDRVIGYYEETNYSLSGRRQGVSIDDVISTLNNPLDSSSGTSPDGMPSLTLYGENCQVTVNPQTGFLIQTNVQRRSSRA